LEGKTTHTGGSRVPRFQKKCSRIMSLMYNDMEKMCRINGKNP
jgi:hypothetical protein